MQDRYSKNHPLLSIITMSVCLAGILQSNVFSQQANHRSSRELVIGDLVGRTDVRNLEILTRQGYLPVSSSGNGKPFKVVTFSPNNIILEFYRYSDATVSNPNQVRYQFYESERALISALILEEVDMAELENEDSALEVQKSNNHLLPLPVPMQANTVKLIFYNNRHEILKLRSVRVALSYAINHEYIIRRILGDKANIARGPFDNDSPLYNSGMEAYKYNPKKAIQLLQDVGWIDRDGDGILDKGGAPLQLTLYYPKGLRIDEAISRHIKINLIKIGIDVKPRPLTKSNINDALASGNFEAVLTEHTFDNGLHSIEEVFSADGEENYMGYRNNTLENYLKFYYANENPDKRRTLIKSMQSVINLDQPVTFLYFKWLTHYLVNVEKFDNYRETEGEARGRLKPFEEWIIKAGER